MINCGTHCKDSSFFFFFFSSFDRLYTHLEFLPSLAIEKSIEEDFIQPDAGIAERTSQLLNLVSLFDDSALEAFTRFLREKKAYAQTQTQQ